MMELTKKGEMVVEILLGLILIVLLIILILLFTNPSLIGKTKPKGSTGDTVIYNIYNAPKQKYCEIVKVPYQTASYEYVEDKIDLRYSSYAVRERSSVRTDRYVVYVKNRDYKTGYFTVRFYFEDYYGDEVSYSVSYYLKPNEERKFVYQDIYSDRYKHYSWTYKVIPGTRTASEKYYDYEPARYELKRVCY